MAVKNYGIHDKWTDLDKLNNVDIKSVDGVIESVKINGEEAGGGGGSSDFSTVNLTIKIVGTPGGGTVLATELYGAFISTEDKLVGKVLVPTTPGTEALIPVVMYKNQPSSFDLISQSVPNMPTYTDTITYDMENNIWTISGDGAITLDVTPSA